MYFTDGSRFGGQGSDRGGRRKGLDVSAMSRESSVRICTFELCEKAKDRSHIRSRVTGAGEGGKIPGENTL